MNSVSKIITSVCESTDFYDLVIRGVDAVTGTDKPTLKAVIRQMSKLTPPNELAQEVYEQFKHFATFGSFDAPERDSEWDDQCVEKFNVCEPATLLLNQVGKLTPELYEEIWNAVSPGPDCELSVRYDPKFVPFHLENEWHPEDYVMGLKERIGPEGEKAIVASGNEEVIKAYAEKFPGVKLEWAVNGIIDWTDL
jgi:hypothetical protein